MIRALRFLHDLLTALQRLAGAVDVVDELVDLYVPAILTPEDEPEAEEELDHYADRQNAALGTLMRTIYCRAGISDEMIHQKHQ